MSAEKKTSFTFVSPAAAGAPRHPPAAGGHILSPIFFLAISSQHAGVEARDCAHTYLQLKDGVLKFGVNSM